MIMCKLYTSTGARHPIVRFCKKDHECTLNNVIDQRFWMLIWLSIFIQYCNSTHTYLFNLILVSKQHKGRVRFYILSFACFHPTDFHLGISFRSRKKATKHLPA